MPKIIRNEDFVNEAREYRRKGYDLKSIAKILGEKFFGKAVNRKTVYTAIIKGKVK